MKSQLWLAVVLTAGLFFATSCSHKNEVDVTSQSFGNEVDQQQNLTFNFSRDLQPDTLLQRWDSTDYIEFSPAVHGAFKWNSSSELQFSPSEGFQPGTDYTAKVTNAVFNHATQSWHLGSSSFSFHTAPLRVAATHLSYARGQSGGNVMTQLDLDFNYEVKVADAAARMKLSSGGNAVSFNAVNGGQGKTVSVQFLPLSGDDKEVPLKIEVAKGIPIAKAKNTSSNDTAFTTDVPSRFSMAITDISSQHDGTQGIVTVNTSQPVAEEGLKNFIGIEPAVAFTVQAVAGGFTITSADMKPDQTYELNVSHQLEGEFHGLMKEDYSEQITFGKLEPAIHFVNTKGMYLSSRGYKNLALNIVSVPQVEVTVVKVYENNLEHFLRKGTSSDYGSDEEGNGSGSYEMYQTENMGDTIFHQTYQTDKLPGKNAARILHLDFSDRVKGYNGVYVVSVASKDHYWVQESKVLSISDIGMIVKEDKDNMYVFANSIHDAKPLSGVAVSFVSTNNQKLFTAKTDGDGMAVFKEISKQNPGFHVGLVTAKMDDEFSFVWLDGARIETSRYDVGGRMPNATGLNAMIYAERNLYRPGEVAHVSTIVRDEGWNNPGAIPVKLKLTMPNGKEFGTMRKY